MVVDDIQKVLDTVNNIGVDSLDGDMLSRAVAKLAILLSSLSPVKDDLEIELDTIEGRLGFERDDTFLMSAENTSENKAKAEAKLATKSLFEEMLKKKRELLRVKSLYYDTDRVISTLQSRLKILTMEFRNSARAQNIT
jgi:hypothetical protein